MRPARPGAALGLLLHGFWGAEFAEHLPALRAGSAWRAAGSGRGAFSRRQRQAGAALACSAFCLSLWGGGRRRGTAALLRGGRPAGRGHRLWAAAVPARKARRGHPAARHGLCRGSGQSGARPAGAGGGRLRGGCISSVARERAGLRWPSVRCGAALCAADPELAPAAAGLSCATGAAAVLAPGRRVEALAAYAGGCVTGALCVQPPGNAFSALLSAGAGLGWSVSCPGNG